MKTTFLLSITLLAGAVTLGSSVGQAHAQEAQQETGQAQQSPQTREAPQTPDEVFGKDAMARARAALRKEMGGHTNWLVIGDRLEYQTGEGDPAMLWDIQGWIGSDTDRLWLKTEGLYLGDEGQLDEGEIQALYSRAISPFFDFQAGIRQDFAAGPKRTYGVLGFQGLAPYWFEIEAAAFISDKGDVTARIEAEYELLLTQRLIFQPRIEVNLSAQNIPELRTGSGLSSAQLEGRLRYEFRRTIAPYVGLSWSRATGRTAKFLRADGEDPGRLSFVTGIRFWF